ncbi:MAG TPA: peptidoglycan-binding protein [Candidatus Dormibacteraeota bacterium]
MRARRAILGFGLVVAIAGLGLVIAAGRGTPDGRRAAAASTTTTTAKVVRTDLVDRQNFPGTLGYGASTPLVNHLSGSVTAEAAAGTNVERGQALYAVNGRSAYLMYGAIPAYRDLQVGVSDGDDVKQLEENLIALGFASSQNLKTTGHFDAYDAAAVERWQRSIGVTADGKVALGVVVFEPGAVRIAAWHATVGEAATPGGPIADVTATSHLVTLNLDARRQTLAVTGSAVTVTLPSGKTTNGHIQSVGTVATAGTGNNPATIPVYITLDDPSAGGNVDQAPVTVGLAGQTAKGVLAVPVNALLARPDGTYAVELVRGGKREVVPVTVGLFAQGMVQVSGAGIAEGDTVVVPAQ